MSLTPHLNECKPDGLYIKEIYTFRAKGLRGQQPTDYVIKLGFNRGQRTREKFHCGRRI
jgi:hypothetical protein